MESLALFDRHSDDDDDDDEYYDDDDDDDDGQADCQDRSDELQHSCGQFSHLLCLTVIVMMMVMMMMMMSIMMMMMMMMMGKRIVRTALMNFSTAVVSSVTCFV